MAETYTARSHAGVQPPRLSRPALYVLIGVPLAWAVLLLFHPAGEGDQIYQDLHDNVSRWMVVHVGMMLFIPSWAQWSSYSCAASRGPRRR